MPTSNDHTIHAGSVLLHYAGSVRTQPEFDEVRKTTTFR